MTPFATKFTLHSAYDRPDLIEVVQNPHHPLERAWPAFIEHTQATKRYWKHLATIPQLAIFQLFVTVPDDEHEASLAYGTEKVVARAHAVPFYRPLRTSARNAPPSQGGSAGEEDDFEPLPNGGWDVILERGVAAYLEQQQHQGPPAGPKPRANTLSALSVTIDPAYRRQGLAECLIGMMKEKAQRAGFHSLVVPLRPTMKAQFPEVEMEVYARWTRDGRVLDKWPAAGWEKGTEPFDPWLRKHVSLGARMIKVAPRSMLIEGDLQSWSEWTGKDLRFRVKRAVEAGNWREDESGQEFVAIAVDGGLNTVRYFPLTGLLRYVEANIWVQYTW